MGKYRYRVRFEVTESEQVMTFVLEAKVFRLIVEPCSARDMASGIAMID